jgi:hypothetical protein
MEPIKAGEGTRSEPSREPTGSDRPYIGLDSFRYCIDSRLLMQPRVSAYRLRTCHKVNGAYAKRYVAAPLYHESRTRGDKMHAPARGIT